MTATVTNVFEVQNDSGRQEEEAVERQWKMVVVVSESEKGAGRCLHGDIFHQRDDARRI